MSCAKLLTYHPKDILIETGSGKGKGISCALQCGFKEIYSIEIEKTLYNFCVKKFRNNKNVHLYHGDSIEILPQILSKINTRATFFLDAHVMSLQATHGKTICPIIEELKIIINHSKKYGFKHSILIDDAKFFNGTVEPFGHIKSSDIKKAITDIDSSYIVKIGRISIYAA